MEKNLSRPIHTISEERSVPLRIFFRQLIVVVTTAVIALLPHSKAIGQNFLCGSATPTFTVNLTNSVNASWISPSVQRADSCCGSMAPNTCIQFVITLNQNSTGIVFDIHSGAVPPGALFYQINCQPPTPVGSPICLNGPGPHILTFCKPGNNTNEYIISAIPNVTAGNDITLNDGCMGTIGTTGFEDTTITWTSIFPGPQGTYNHYLSCTQGCDTVQVVGSAPLPAYVDYLVCGYPTGNCGSQPVCDTVRVYFNPSLNVSITPINPVICFGNTTTTITANPQGGTLPYHFQWQHGPTSPGITVGPGTYIVTLTDSSNCPGVSDTVVVTQFQNPITAQAGADQSSCGANPVFQLNGSVTGVSTGIWVGGNGTFSPSNSALNATYTPTAAEVSAGSVTLILQTTNNAGCPGDADTIQLFMNQFNAQITTQQTPPSCFGYSNGSASVNIAGGAPPFSFNWNTNPAQFSATALNLAAGNFSCIVTDANGCSQTISVTITNPPALTIHASGFASTCATNCNGQAIVLPSGGTGSYSYMWQPGNFTSASVTGLCVGTYSISVMDQNGCSVMDTAIVNEPPAIQLSASTTPAYCNLPNGAANVTVTGGSGNYSYQWINQNNSTSSIQNVASGSYTIVVTDNYNCSVTDTVVIGTAPGFVSTISNTTATSCDYSCDGQATISVSGGYAPYQFYWNNTPVTSSTTVSNLCPGNNQVIVVDSYGCQDTLAFSVNAPAPLIAMLDSIPTLCMGQVYNMSYTATGGTAPYTAQWPQGGPVFTAPGSGAYHVVVTDAQGCTDTSSVVTIMTHPPLQVTVSGNPTGCSNQPVQVLAQAGGGNGGPYHYSWSHSSTNSNAVSISLTQTATIYVTVSDNCTSPAATDSMVIQIFQPPVVAFTIDDTIGCGNDCAQLTNTTPNSVHALWQISDGYTGTATTFNHCFAVGTHAVTLIVTDGNGCVDTLTHPSAMIVHPNPTAAFTLGPQPTTILEPTICFTDQSSNDVVGWYWNFNDPNDQTTSYVQHPCHAYSDTGTFCATLVVTNNFGCISTTSTCLIIQPYFTIYVPNAFTPNGDGVNDVFFPVANHIQIDTYEMVIYDRWGNLIFETNDILRGWNGCVQGSSQIVLIDTYVWKIQVKDYTGRRHRLLGHVSVIK